MKPTYKFSDGRLVPSNMLSVECLLLKADDQALIQDIFGNLDEEIIHLRFIFGDLVGTFKAQLINALKSPPVQFNPDVLGLPQDLKVEAHGNEYEFIVKWGRPLENDSIYFSLKLEPGNEFDDVRNPRVYASGHAINLKVRLQDDDLVLDFSETMTTKIFLPKILDEKFKWSLVKEMLSGRIQIYAGYTDTIKSVFWKQWKAEHPREDGMVVEIYDIGTEFTGFVFMVQDVAINCHVFSLVLEFECSKDDKTEHVWVLDEKTPAEMLRFAKSVGCEVVGCSHAVNLVCTDTEERTLGTYYQLRPSVRNIKMPIK